MIRTRDILRETEISERQLNYWVTAGIIPVKNGQNPGSGMPRQYDNDVIPKIELMVAVSKISPHGVGVDVLKKIYENFDNGSIHIGDDIFLCW